MSEESRGIATAAEMKVLASPVRLRILRLTMDAALTNAELAAALELTPATTLYHVRQLVAAGFLAADAEGRPGRAIPYRATGRSWQVEPKDDDIPAAVDAMLSAYVDEWRRGGRRAAKFGVRMRLHLDDDALDEFGDRLTDLIDEFRARPRADGSRAYSLLALINEEPG